MTLVSSLEGSDDLLVLEMKLIANNSKLTMGQGDVNVLSKELHSFGHQVLEVVELLEGDSRDL